MNYDWFVLVSILNHLLLEGKKALVPLTSSVYVDAELIGTERVLVDIGTGYFIEQVEKKDFSLILYSSSSY